MAKHSKEQRNRAVDLYIKYEHSAAGTIRCATWAQKESAPTMRRRGGREKDKVLFFCCIWFLWETFSRSASGG